MRAIKDQEGVLACRELPCSKSGLLTFRTTTCGSCLIIYRIIQLLNTLPHPHHHPRPLGSCFPQTASGMDRHTPGLQAERAGSGHEVVVSAMSWTLKTSEKCRGFANSTLLLSSTNSCFVSCLQFPLKACTVLTVEGCCKE